MPVSELLNIFNAVLFAAVVAVATHLWISRRDAPSMWFAIAFSMLLLATLIDEFALTFNDTWSDVLLRFAAAPIALFPYMLFRFAAALRPSGKAIHAIIATVSALLAVMPAVMASSPNPTLTVRETWHFIYTDLWLAQWAITMVLVAGYLLKTSTTQPRLACRRLKVISSATVALLIAAILGVVGAATDDALLVVQGQVVTFIATLLYLFGLAPPQVMRVVWRIPEGYEFERTLPDLMQVTSLEELESRVLPRVVEVLGGRGAILLDAKGDVRASTGEPVASSGDDQVHVIAASGDGSWGRLDGDRVFFRYPDGMLVVGLDGSIPLFGLEEVQYARAVAAVVGIAVERVLVFEREREAAERLRELDQLKNDFVAMVAHDLRSPLTVIAGFADTLAGRWGELDDAQRGDFLQLISQNAHGVADLVEDVLQVSRIEAGDYHIESAVFDLADVVQRTATELGRDQPADRIRLMLDESLPRVVGDEERTWQVLTNLMSNALKFSPEATTVTVEAHPNGAGTVALSVRDHGIGIDHEDVPKLFQRFSRVHISTPENGLPKGTGLGLYICRALVEAQGGTITVDTAPGKGSTFTFTLPIAR